jgi:MIP family channel proteins
MTTSITPPAKLEEAPDPHRTRGLHGHSHDMDLLRVCVAEALGTFVLVLTIICTAIAASLSRSVAGIPYGSLAVPLAGGAALASMVAAFGPTSGAHLNPAVTIGLAVNRRFPWVSVLPYVVAQFVGALAAALAAWAVYGSKARTLASLGATYPAQGVGAWRALLAEFIVTMLLVAVIVTVALRPNASLGVSALAIGAALAVAILISGPVSGAGVNPARALGPMIPSEKFTDWWVYLVGPIVGASVAIVAVKHLIRPPGLTCESA